MDALRDGWFSELSSQWPGQALSLEVDELLYHKKSAFQDIMVLKTKTHGNALVLDGVIQCTEKDEFSYQEMITHLPVNCHPNPEQVLVIGGGDGGVVRELTKHPKVKSVTMCEIDQEVVDVSKKYLPFMATGFDSPKLTLHIGDGFEFMKRHNNEFDVIITDSSDPVGPASALFDKSYYELMKAALKPGGIVCSQGETPWLMLDLIKSMMTFNKDLYPVVEYALCSVPTYPTGQIGFALCSLNPATVFREPLHIRTDKEVEELGLRYYNLDIHRASFTLPQFVLKVLGK